MALSYSQGLFLDLLRRAAFEICPQYGLSPQVCIAQGIVESGWGWQKGRSEEQCSLSEILFRRGFNIFNIPGSGDDGCQYWQTHYYKGHPPELKTHTVKMARFSGLDAALHGYCLFVSRASFKPALSFVPNDPGRFIVALWGLGYASHPEYVEAVMGVMETIYHDSMSFMFNVTVDNGLKESLAFLKSLPAGAGRRKVTKQEIAGSFRKTSPFVGEAARPVAIVDKFSSLVSTHASRLQIAVAWAKELFSIFRR